MIAIHASATTKALYVVLDEAGCVSLYWTASRGEALRQATQYIAAGEYGTDECDIQMIRFTIYRVSACPQERGV